MEENNQVFLKKIKELDKKIKLDPKNEVNYFNRGWNYSELEKYQEAINDYTSAIILNPNYANAYLNRGWCYGELGNYKKAIDDHTISIKLNPNNANAYFNRGWNYSELGKHQEAIDDYTAAINLDPNDANVYFNRGWIYGELKKYQEAIDDYTAAINLDPNYRNAYFNRGWNYSELGKHQEAINDYTAAINLDPNYRNAYFNRGVNYEKLKDYQKAIDDYTAAINLDSEYASAYFNRGWNYAKLKDYQKAIDDYTAAINLDPNYRNAYFNRGCNYGRLEKYQKAIDDYTAAINLDSEYASAYFNRGWSYEKLSNHTKAIEDYTTATNLDSQNKKYQVVLANSKNGKTSKKIETSDNFAEPKTNSEKISNETTNLIELNTSPKSEEETKKSFLTFADILGWKGIWQRDKNINSKFINVDKLKIIKSNLLSYGNKISKNIDINLISDTFIIGSDKIEINNELCKKLIALCLEQNLLIRGATAFGEYYSDEMIYIGEAVDEAASWHEKGEEIGIFYTPSARLKLEKEIKKKLKNKKKSEDKIKKEFLEKIGLFEKKIITKIGEVNSYVIPWFKENKNKNSFFQIMEKEIVFPEISKKYFNTEKTIKDYESSLEKNNSK
ncbi:tetratricopeptide repeat protein [uncultured Fusobacterium sp.]|uniref:tetratricopeptide repeat protein n=1 Tax=uncultured Fusobacterium sp. TaxID=159267 RepID=UPI002598273D|nr:tetratricopeptide repeat protein [uncultured Fusobacterium sp.]